MILGGNYGDVPLEVGAGKLIADLVVGEGLSVVLDLSHFRKGEPTRFMTDVAERLYHKNRTPLRLVLDEADAFAPQRPLKGQERLLGPVQDLVCRGRARGIGVTLVTQRAAVLNKDVLTQAEVLVALRTIAPQEREARMASLPSLPVGTAWFWSPGWLDVFKGVRIRRRETFASSATPRVGVSRQEPKMLAAVDLERLRGCLSATIEQARAEDPRALRRRSAELEQARRPPTIIERVEVPILHEDQVKKLKALVVTLRAVTEDVSLALTTACGQLQGVSEVAQARSTRGAEGVYRERRDIQFLPWNAPPEWLE